MYALTEVGQDFGNLFLVGVEEGLQEGVEGQDDQLVPADHATEHCHHCHLHLELLFGVLLQLTEQTLTEVLGVEDLVDGEEGHVLGSVLCLPAQLPPQPHFLSLHPQLSSLVLFAAVQLVSLHQDALIYIVIAPFVIIVQTLRQSGLD